MDCPLCGTSIADGRPRYRILLNVDNDLLPEDLSDGDEEEGDVVEAEICADCWREYQRRLG